MIGLRTTRRGALGAGAALAGGLLGACAVGSGARPGDGGGVAPAAPSGPQRVEVWWSIADNNPSIAPAWEDFKQRHAGWTGELTMGVTYDKFQASIAGGIVPDAYFGSFQNVQAGAYKKLFAPLDRYIGRDKVDLNQYYVGSRAGAVFRGQVYALPHHSNVRSLYVNDRLYREVGLDPSRAPASWDDLRAANQRLKIKSAPGALDRVGYNPTWQLGGPTAAMYFQANGVPLFTADDAQPGFATAAGGEALKWVQELVAALGGQGALAEYQRKFSRGPGEALGRGASGVAMAGIWVVPRDAMGINPDLVVSQWPIPGGPSARGKTFGYVAATSGVVPTAAAPGCRLGVDEVPGLGGGAALHPGPQRLLGPGLHRQRG